MLRIVYFSNVSLNTHRFVEKLDWGAVTRIPVQGVLELPVEEPYVLISPTYGSLRSGYLPRQVKRFLSDSVNQTNLVGVIGAGNINFGEEYALAADLVSSKFQVPVLYRFELAGTSVDVDKVQKGLVTFEENLLISRVNN